MSGAPAFDRRDALGMAGGAALLSLAGVDLVPSPAEAAAPIAAGRGQPFDRGWRFLRGVHTGLERADLDDAAWRSVDLPHDWSIEDVPGDAAAAGPFTPASEGRGDVGWTLGGEGWYRKRFAVGQLPPGGACELLFEGAYCETDVWLNGRHVRTNLNGYAPFVCDLTPALVAGGENVLAVRVRNPGRNSRWYAGSGLYRRVTLDVVPQAERIARWGVAAWTRRVDGDTAEIDVTTRLLTANPALELVTRLREPSGRIAAEAAAPAAGEVRQRLRVPAARLWSIEQPRLYVLETELRDGRRTIDVVRQDFGIRIVSFAADSGMTLNGKRVTLRGGCLHHDHGLLGAKSFADADQRRIARLKARGFNAIRSAHNPASADLRAACDRLGLLLIDEAFDAWQEPKLPDDFARHFAADWENVIEAMVLAGRNSPSIVMWSIGNEIPARSTPAGVKWQWMLANAVRRLDPTRPVTAGLNGLLGAEMTAPAQTARAGHAGEQDNASTIFLDVAGYNYRLDDIEADAKAHPDRIVYASETFPTEAYDYLRLAERAPYFLGEFVWAAADYLGEAGIGISKLEKVGQRSFPFAAYPWVIANCGDLDLIGEQRPQSLARDVVWGVSPVEITVGRPLPEGYAETISKWGWPDELPSWTWPGAQGKPLAVRVHSAADRVELRLNGRLVGEHAMKPGDRMVASFTIPYEEGTLEARAFRNGQAAGRRSLTTVGAAARLLLSPEGATGPADRQRLLHVPIAIVDADGRILPDEVRPVTLVIRGPVELAGFGSACPLATGSFQSPKAATFRGRALAILRSNGAPGTVHIEACADGLASGTATIRLR